MQRVPQRRQAQGRLAARLSRRLEKRRRYRRCHRARRSREKPAHQVDPSRRSRSEVAGEIAETRRQDHRRFREVGEHGRARSARPGRPRSKAASPPGPTCSPPAAPGGRCSPYKNPPCPRSGTPRGPPIPSIASLLARMEEHGLSPAADADPRTFIRRLTFALTGLPPTPAEVEAFVVDSAHDSPGAIQKATDRLWPRPVSASTGRGTGSILCATPRPTAAKATPRFAKPGAIATT